jgi:cytochrome P450
MSHPSLPIFTLPVPFSRIYIVTDPSLSAAVQRASKTLSFSPLVPDITKRVLGLDAPTVASVRSGLEPEPGEPHGYIPDIHDMVYSYLGPGTDLSELTLAATAELAEQVSSQVAGMAESGRGVEPVPDLLVWIRHFVAVGTARFLYGAENPLALDPALEESFWDFDHGLGGLLMGVMPSVTARKAHRGRELLAAAFAEYMEAGRYKNPDVSDIIRRRVEIADAHGWSIDGKARSEVSFLFAGIVNTATTTFWTALHTFARRDLLDAVRAELLANVVVPDTDKTSSVTTLSIDALKTSSPTLLAVMRECLRLGSDNYSTRLVKTDTELAGGQYHLKANSVVQIAGGVMHADTSIWGPDADQFNPARFLKMQQGNGATESSTASAPQVHPAAFRAFGGGKTLCPGRHFATYEILAFVAMIVLMFDIEPLEGDGSELQIPSKDDSIMPVHILEPTKPVRVAVKLREGMSRGIRVV